MLFNLCLFDVVYNHTIGSIPGFLNINLTTKWNLENLATLQHIYISTNFFSWFDYYYGSTNPGMKPVVWFYTTTFICLSTALATDFFINYIMILELDECMRAYTDDRDAAEDPHHRESHHARFTE